MAWLMVGMILGLAVAGALVVMIAVIEAGSDADDRLEEAMREMEEKFGDRDFGDL